MKKTGTEIEEDVYLMLCRSGLNRVLRGTVYRDGMRPINSQSEDAVIKFLAGLDNQVQSGVVILNIYVPNIDAGTGYKVKDVARCKALEKSVHELIQGLTIQEYDLSFDGIPQAFEVEGLEQYFINVRLNFRRITN